MEGVIISIEFKEHKPWKDMSFYNYNTSVKLDDGSVMAGFVSSPNVETTLIEGDRITFEEDQTQFGIKFKGAKKIHAQPVQTTMYPEKQPGSGPERNLDALKAVALKHAITYWDGNVDRTEEKVVATAKTFFEWLWEPASKSLDLPF